MFGLFSVCHITSEASEVHWFTAAAAWPVLGAFAAFLCLLALTRRTGLARAAERRAGMITAALLCLLTAGSVLWVIKAGVKPEADPYTVIDIAAKWRQGDFSAMLHGGYLYMYPHQIGLVLFYYFTSFICGSYGFRFWQLCNAAALAGGVWFLALTAETLFPRRWMRPAVTGCCCLFLPLLFYTSFNYGTLYGFFCSMAAFYLLVRFLGDGGWGRAAGGAALAALAAEFKQNYLVSLTAMAVILLLAAVRRKSLRPVLAAALLGAAALLFSWGVRGAAAAMSGLPVPDGVPKTAWVMMGLQESKRAPGWYNDSSLDLYEACGEDTAAADAAARTAISARLREFASDPEYAAGFFARKLASQWNEPTFQCLWINSVRKSFDSAPQGVKNILAGSAALRIEGFLRYFDMFVYLGVLCFLLFRREKPSEQALLLAVTFIGGFLFHMFWEAKAEYTFLYFVLLIPYAAEGWVCAAERGTELVLRRDRARAARTAIVLALTAALICHPGFVRSYLGLGSDGASYAGYISQREDYGPQAR